MQLLKLLLLSKSIRKRFSLLLIQCIFYSEEAANKTLEESLGTDDTPFSSYEMTQRGAITKRGTLSRSTLGRRSVGGATAIVSAKTPPRPAPASVTYSDDDTVKGYDEDPDDDSSDVTEKPTDISSTDSQVKLVADFLSNPFVSFF